MYKGESFWHDLKPHLVVNGILVFILGINSAWLLIPGTFLLYALYWYSRRLYYKKHVALNIYLDEVTKKITASSFYALQEIKEPVCVINESGKLDWQNKSFLATFGVEDVENFSLQQITNDLNTKEIIEEKGNKIIFYKGKIWQVSWQNVTPTMTEETISKMVAIYFNDVTELENLKHSYDQEKTVVAYLQIDNYSDVLKNLTDNQRENVTAEVNKLVGLWIHELSATYNRFSNDTFFIIMDKLSLSKLIKQKFDIVDRVRKIKAGNKVPVTFSIGVATENKSIMDIAQKAQSCLDIALGRGGDQAAVSIDNQIQFFGGKTAALEKNNRVRSRTVAQAIKELINDTQAIFIMGHTNEDFDSLGSAMGVAKMCKIAHKTVYIVHSGRGASIAKLKEFFNEYPEFKDVFITSIQASTLVTKDSLLFLVDHHRAILSACPELLTMIDKKVIIDHHRRAEDMIQGTVLMYLEPSSSSTSELITELLYYFDDQTDFTRLETSTLYAGIVLDTKNFAVQTGARTFEAASFLRRAGADPAMVKKLFSEGWETAKAKASLISRVEVSPQGIAFISCAELKVNTASNVIAQVADSLLDMDGVKVSVVITEVEGEVIISARSNGEINVQLTMEQIGGGGHQTVAGAQIKNQTMEEVKERILGILNQQIEQIEEKVKNESAIVTRS